MLHLIQEQNIGKEINKLSLKRKENTVFASKKNFLERQPKVDEVNTQNNKRKVFAYGAFAAITLSGVAAIAFTKGKFIKNFLKDAKNENLQKTADEVAEKAKKTAEDAKRAAEEEKTKLEQQVNEYFQSEEKELRLSKQKISESNAKNEQWLEEQHNKKEREYSDFWNKNRRNHRLRLRWLQHRNNHCRSV